MGTVLASLFFIIMIADIDQNLENSISRLFVDDTKHLRVPYSHGKNMVAR